MVLQRIPFMAGVCSLVRRAGRLHFIGRHLGDRHYDAPQFEAAALATAEATASRIAGPRECPASTATKPWTKIWWHSSGVPCSQKHADEISSTVACVRSRGAPAVFACAALTASGSAAEGPVSNASRSAPEACLVGSGTFWYAHAEYRLP